MERFGIPIGWNREYFKRTKVPNGISKWPLWAPMKQYKNTNKLLNEDQIKAAIPYINWFVISVFWSLGHFMFLRPGVVVPCDHFHLHCEASRFFLLMHKRVTWAEVR